MRVRPGRIVLQVGEPVNPRDFTDRDALMKVVRERMEALVAEARG
jgi:hypothetical protein